MKTQPAPIEEPTKELAHAEVSAKEADPTEVPTEVADPTEVPSKEPVTLMATVSGPAEEPTIPPVQCEEKGEGEVPHSDFPGWTEVLHLTWSVTSARQALLTLSELR